MGSHRGPVRFHEPSDRDSTRCVAAVAAAGLLCAWLLGACAAERIAEPGEAIDDGARTEHSGSRGTPVERSAVGSGEEAAGPSGPVFVVQTRDTTDAGVLRERISSRYGPRVGTERLFPDIDPTDDPEGMARMFRVSIPDDGLEAGWDGAYRLQEEFDLVAAEPDTATTIEASPESTRQCFVEHEPPSNRTWSLEKIRADQAWELAPPTGGLRFGEGISVCHPDTGWAEHDELDAARLDLSRATNLLGSGPADGRDPLDYSGGLLNPGHGTGTGTVIVSEHAGEVFGVAPAATLVPIRTVKSVIQVFDSDLARAVNYSVDAGCEVVSMSLGGRSFFGLKAAIARATRENVVVAAAAGNCVGFVVAPAAYPDTVAVAGIDIGDDPWPGSSKGRAVDISAPAEHVWTAKRRAASAPTNETTPGQGTSYAVANTAGAAALWLAFHGRDHLLNAYPDEPLQSVFRRHLAQTARTPTGWDDRYGAGVLDVYGLLSEPLPDVLEAAPLRLDSSQLEILAAMIDRSTRATEALFAEIFGLGGEALRVKLEQLGPELTQLALESPEQFRAWLRSGSGEEASAGDGGVPEGASATLRRTVQ